MLSAVAQFKQLEESLRGWGGCSKAIRRALLPEAAVEHSQKVLEADSRLRMWQLGQQSDWGLLYRCSQAQLDFKSPAGGALSVCTMCVPVQVDEVEYGKDPSDFQLCICFPHEHRLTCLAKGRKLINISMSRYWIGHAVTAAPGNAG